MSQRYVNVPSLLGRLTIGLGLSVLSCLFLTSYLHAHAQSSCTAYYQCTALQEVSSVKVQGPITYWFDNEQIEGVSFLTQDDANNFRDRLRAAAADWATKTGVSITEASSGDVRIRVSGAGFYTASNGKVEPDQNHPGSKVMTFSTEWPQWSSAGKIALRRTSGGIS